MPLVVTDTFKVNNDFFYKRYMYSKDAFKAKPNQNQNVKPMLKKDSCNNAVFKSMKTLIKRKARFTMDKSGNESKKYR